MIPTMKRIAYATNPARAHLMLGLLEENGIRACIQGEALWAARGELPLTSESAPTLWVADEADVDLARQILATHDTPLRSDDSWTCSHCNEASGTQFTNCWNCGAGRDAIAGTSSQIAVDEQSETMSSSTCPSCGGTGRIEHRLLPVALLVCGAFLGFAAIHNLLDPAIYARAHVDHVVARAMFAGAAFLCFYFTPRVRRLPCPCREQWQDENI
jgi:hypothetical protein